MIVLLLIATGALFALLFIVSSFVRAAQGHERVGFFETLLAFLSLILPLLAIVNNNASEQPLALVNTAAVGIAIVVIIVSIIILLVEQRKSPRKFNQRRGVLGIGLGALLIGATFLVPVTSKLIAPPPIAMVAFNASPDGVVNISAQPGGKALTDNAPAAIGGGTAPEDQVALAPTSTPVVSLSATPTRLPSVTPTPTNTPYVLVSPTPGTASSAEVEEVIGQTHECWALVNWNLNLRTGPGAEYPRLLTIPYTTTVSASGRNEASTWWFVTYEAESGWVDGEYISVSGNCASLPVTEAS